MQQYGYMYKHIFVCAHTRTHQSASRQRLGNWQDSHFCSHALTQQKDALHCVTVCHYAAAQDVG